VAAVTRSRIGAWNSATRASFHGISALRVWRDEPPRRHGEPRQRLMCEPIGEVLRLDNPDRIRDLQGRRILVVEDSPVVAPLTGEMLEELGCVVVGPAISMAAARPLAEGEEIDGAIVDIRIRGEKVFPVCEILAGRAIPFVLTSGYADWPMPEKWRDRPQLPKPYKLKDVEAALMGLFS